MFYIRLIFFIILLNPFFGGLAYGSPPKKVYISMTTSPERLKSIHLLLKELREWIISDEITKVYIHIPEKYRNSDEGLYDPRRLAILQDLFSRDSKLKDNPGYDGKVEFNRIPNDYGPITKIAPARARALADLAESSHKEGGASPVSQSRDAYVISIDDDYLYKPEYLKSLVDQLIERNRSIQVSALAYKTGKVELWGIQKSAPSHMVGGQRFPNIGSSVDMIEGWGGIAYRLEDIDSKLMFRLSQRSLECRLSDDLVISFVMGVNRKLKQSARFLVREASAAVSVPSAQGGGESEALSQRASGDQLVPLTDIGALSAGSGLENWFHLEAWDDFKAYILDNGGRSGQVRQLAVGGGLQEDVDDLDESYLESSGEAASLKADSFSVLPLLAMRGRERFFHRDQDVIHTRAGGYVKVFGRSKIGFVGQQFAQNLISELETRARADQAEFMAQGTETPTEIERRVYRALFNQFIKNTALKIDGYKYKRCLGSLNACAYSVGPKPKLKKWDEIYRDCVPEGTEARSAASASEDPHAGQVGSAESALSSQ